MKTEFVRSKVFSYFMHWIKKYQHIICFCLDCQLGIAESERATI